MIKSTIKKISFPLLGPLPEPQDHPNISSLSNSLLSPLESISLLAIILSYPMSLFWEVIRLSISLSFVLNQKVATTKTKEIKKTRLNILFPNRIFNPAVTKPDPYHPPSPHIVPRRGTLKRFKNGGKCLLNFFYLIEIIYI